MAESEVFVSLEPFVHQVSGHCCFMKFNDVSVCKPLNPREHRIYKDLPLELRPFTPEYRGVAQVSFQEDKEGNITVIAHPSDDKAVKRLQSKSSNSSSDNGSDDDIERTHVKRSSLTSLIKASVEKNGKHRMMLRSGHTEPLADCTGKTSSENTGTTWPWYLQCQKRNFDQIKANTKEHKLHEYIILENITYYYHLPCILDLKIGTQQHGDDASQEKRIKMMKKVAMSTSSTLGVRIAGMQVYKRKTHQLLCRNKYDGMKLSVEGFKRELCNFLHDGERLAVEHIQPFINKLQRLHKVIEKQQSFRFFSSSLLLIYEGQEPSDLYQTKNYGKDFLSSTLRDSKERNETELLHVCSKETAGDKKQTKMDESSRAGKSFTPKRNIDVRLIDFAHTTHSGFSEDRTRFGPDKGCLLGIRSTIRMLEEILKEHGT